MVKAASVLKVEDAAMVASARDKYVRISNTVVNIV
jgi:hypothetical protein